MRKLLLLVFFFSFQFCYSQEIECLNFELNPDSLTSFLNMVVDNQRKNPIDIGNNNPISFSEYKSIAEKHVQSKKDLNSKDVANRYFNELLPIIRPLAGYS